MFVHDLYPEPLDLVVLQALVLLLLLLVHRMYTLSSGMSAIFTLGAWGSILRFSSRRDLRQEINKSIHNNSFLVFLPDPVHVLGRVMVAHVFRGDVDLEVEARARVLEVVIVRQLVRIERV